MTNLIQILTKPKANIILTKNYFNTKRRILIQQVQTLVFIKIIQRKVLIQRFIKTIQAKQVHQIKVIQLKECFALRSTKSVKIVYSSTLLSGGLLRTFGDEVRGGSELKNSGKYIDKGTQTNVNKLDTESKNEFDTGVPETPDTIVGVIDSYSKSH